MSRKQTSGQLTTLHPAYAVKKHFAASKRAICKSKGKQLS